MENRIIKFRAWDRVALKMSYDFNLFGEFILLGGVHSWQESIGREGESLPLLGDLEIMQFVGLQDKNGVDIYEGDIYAGNKVYQVKWCDGGASNFEWYGACFILWLNDEVFFPFDEYAMKNGKVIGNVHQNKDLLK